MISSQIKEKWPEAEAHLKTPLYLKQNKKTMLSFYHLPKNPKNNFP